jgi:hypothetical protein
MDGALAAILKSLLKYDERILNKYLNIFYFILRVLPLKIIRFSLFMNFYVKNK